MELETLLRKKLKIRLHAEPADSGSPKVRTSTQRGSRCGYQYWFPEIMNMLGQQLSPAVLLMCHVSSALSQTGLLEKRVVGVPERFNHLIQKWVWEGEINQKKISFTLPPISLFRKRK